MRVALALAALVVACTPDIEPDGYLCGQNESCPDGLACSGSDFACEDPATVASFTCNAAPTSAAAPMQLPAMTCASAPVSMMTCLPAGAAGAWFQLASPAMCTSVGIAASIQFPFAFETLDLVLADSTGAPIGSDGDCAVAAAGLDSRCLAQTLADATTYLLEVVPNGNDCDGTCNYNQLSLSVQLVAP